MNHDAPVFRASRLAGSPSPYLRQHAANPVDWHPWGPGAFAEARRLDRPIFLSVGYSSCHWCHVMAHESFEDPAMAEVLNRLFVCVKVDREEHPDVDAVYMRATQLLTGRGGWPNSVWLTPDGRPWFAGTYLPPEDRGGAIGLRTLAERIDAVWRGRRPDVERQADEVTAAVRRAADPAGDPGPPAAGAAADPVAAAAEWLRGDFDAGHGGFRGAPKFPPHGELELLLDLHAATGAGEWLGMVVRTLDAMQAGGIHDAVGGGFHRYAVDSCWFLPHFEKMLSDNARLLAVYAAASVRASRPDFASTARGIAGWMLREMRAPGGGFFTALDADSPGGEGRFYLWDDRELADALGADDHALVRRVFGAVPGGNAHDEATGRPTGLNLLHRTGAARPEDEARIPAVMARLLRARGTRPRPALDDKILAAWNGLAIGALATAGRALGEPAWIGAAASAGEFAWTHLRDGAGRLRRSFAAGAAHHDACLDDVAFLAAGCLDLHDAVGGEAWLDRAGELAGDLLGRFRDRVRGGFFLTADDAAPQIARIRDPYDDALPSGNAVACLVLTRLHRLTQSEVHRVMAEETLRAFDGVLRGGARGAAGLLRAWLGVSAGASARRG